jgi:hypothetical protein
LFHHVRYHEADVLAFEKLGASHWQALLDKGERGMTPESPPKGPLKAFQDPLERDWRSV